MHVAADVGGSSFYEVTFQAKVGDGGWRSIGTDDTAPYQVFHDVSGLRDRHAGAVPRRGARQRRAHRGSARPAARDRAGAGGDHRGARPRAAACAAPSRCRRGRRPGAGRRTWSRSSARSTARPAGRRSAPTHSSPVYTVVRRRSRRWASRPGTPITYRAVLHGGRRQRRWSARCAPSGRQAPPADDGDAALLPAGRRLRRPPRVLGPAHVG